jgi:hypothetical protein
MFPRFDYLATQLDLAGSVLEIAFGQMQTPDVLIFARRLLRGEIAATSWDAPRGRILKTS